MQKILILGKNGMLGQAIDQQSKVQSEKFKVTTWGREELDITNKKSVHKKIEELRPEIVINATGYTNVDGAETEPETAFAVNTEGVAYLAEISAEIGATLFHFSTDYIFDGTQAGGYTEDDEEHIGPLNVYGESKRKGEENVKCQMSNVKWFIIRTSWLYGPGGKNFVDTLLTRAQGGQAEFRVVNDQYGKPTYTGDLAERVVWMVDRLGELESGIYHCVNEVNSNDVVGVSWHQFAKEIFKQAHEDGLLQRPLIVAPCTTAEFSRPAKRPPYSALINTKLPPMREWREALRAYLQKQSDS